MSRTSKNNQPSSPPDEPDETPVNSPTPVPWVEQAPQDIIAKKVTEVQNSEWCSETGENLAGGSCSPVR